MIILNTTTSVLQAVLAGAITTSQPEAVVAFRDVNPNGEETKYSTQRTALNSGTDVTICDAPVQGFVRYVDTITVYNKDTVNAVVTVKIDVSGTEYILVKNTLATTKTLGYEHSTGWFTI